MGIHGEERLSAFKKGVNPSNSEAMCKFLFR